MASQADSDAMDTLVRNTIEDFDNMTVFEDTADEEMGVETSMESGKCCAPTHE